MPFDGPSNHAQAVPLVFASQIETRPRECLKPSPVLAENKTVRPHFNGPQNQRGISTIEMIPVLLLFALMFNVSLGFFGIVHSGILNSIAARNYAFETFRNRANLNYLRDSTDCTTNPDCYQSYYEKKGFRFHGVVSEASGNSNENWIVTRRPTMFTEAQTGVLDPDGVSADHLLVTQISDGGKASDIFSGLHRDEAKNGLSPVWIRTLYGICMHSSCVK